MVTHSEITDAIKARSTWENRQATWYKMRHDGLRRANKPFPGAADMHFPLGDMQVEKLKPFYVGQLYASDTIASFTARQQRFAGSAQTVALWFDNELKQLSNAEDELTIAIDKMLERGTCTVKLFWDPHRKQLRFQAINAVDVIVPASTGRSYEGDWIVHVQRFSKHAYARQKNFRQDPEFVQSITGSKGQDAQETGGAFDEAKVTREGINRSSRDDEIIVWEVYGRDAEGNIRVQTYSPARPTVAIRDEFGLPYNVGVFGEPNPPFPFFDLTAERKDQSYYDPRGIVERLAPFEASLCKDWNTMKDWQTLVCNPVFSAPQGVGNNTNVRMRPGQILPFKLEAVSMGSTPVDLQAAMQGTRNVAEQLVGAPDYGSKQDGKTDNKTAAEVNLIGNVMGVQVDMRGRNYRRELGHGLRMAYCILCQFAADRREFEMLGQYQTVDEGALGDHYRVELNASGDNWNRTMGLQKAQARFQAFRNDPRINQDELYRALLDADDPRLTKVLLIGQGSMQAAQIEDQAGEVTLMLIGFPAEVKPTDDHAAHLQSLAGFIQRRAVKGPPLDGETLALMAQHAAQHVEALRQTNKQAFQQQGRQLAAFAQQLQQAAQQQLMQEQQAQSFAMGQMPDAQSFAQQPQPQPQPFAAA